MVQSLLQLFAGQRGQLADPWAVIFAPKALGVHSTVPTSLQLCHFSKQCLGSFALALRLFRLTGATFPQPYEHLPASLRQRIPCHSLYLINRSNTYNSLGCRLDQSFCVIDWLVTAVFKWHFESHHTPRAVSATNASASQVLAKSQPNSVYTLGVQEFGQSTALDTRLCNIRLG